MKTHLELYKKYRPKEWSDMIGQEKSIESLKNSVISGNIPTAFIFSGTHGSGKTTAAYIFAKAINCENVDDKANPCNKCHVCLTIDDGNGASIGVSTIAMANNGSAEEVRKIMSNADLATIVKKPVLILDEFHSISKTAMESMLIPLEKERTTAVFIMCTTDPDKIIPTIHSRSSRRNFTPVDKKLIFNRLAYILEKEDIVLDTSEIKSIASASKGSVRDAIKFLQEYLETGVIPSSYRIKLIEAIESKNYTTMFQITAEIASDGQSFTKVSEQVYSDIRDILVLAASKTQVKPESVTGKIIQNVPLKTMLKVLNIIGSSLERMSTNTVDSRILFEIMMVNVLTILREK